MDAGIVLVWSAMNAGQAQPSMQAGLPYWVPDFQPNWLAVVNIAIGSDGKPDGLWRGKSEPSNACGVAAQWCLGAPGLVYTPTPNVSGTIFQGGGLGTSFAAPIVAGTAALVLQAYPWMSAGNVTDTILTTATPLDDGSHTTPNPTFDWGMVNAGKAVQGPAQFAFPQFGPFTADIPSGVSSTFANAIGGKGGLKLTGSGTLVLTATNTYAAGSEIAAGTLAVDGAVASDVTVDSGGTLDGTGIVNADVVNAGTVRSAGTAAARGLTIAGNLTDAAGSATAVALGDPLAVGGTASLDGTMRVLAPPAKYTVKSTEPLVNAGSVSGTFQHLAFAAGVFYTGTLGYTATQVNVTLTQNNVQATAAGMAPIASGQAIQSAGNVQVALDVSNTWVASGQVAGQGAWLHAAGTFLAAASAPAAVASLDSLSGEIYATSRAVEAQQAFAADAAIANREHALTAHDRPGLWVQALGADGALARRGYDAADYRAGGTLIGFDGAITRTWSAGVATGRTRIWTHMAGLGGSIYERADVGALYARWHGTHGLYAAARVNHATVRDEVNRDVLLGDMLTGLSGARTDHTTMLTLDGGSAIAVGNATLTPYVALSRWRLHQSAFRERGSAMGLAAPSQTHRATFGTLGVRYGAHFDWPAGRSTLEGYLAWRRVLGGADLGMQAAFAGLPGVMFTAAGANLPRNVGIVGVHWTDVINRRWSWFVDMDYQAGSESLHQTEADTGIRIAI